MSVSSPKHAVDTNVDPTKIINSSHLETIERQHLLTRLRNKENEMTSSLPKTYKVAYFPSKGAPLAFKDVELKLPSPGSVSSRNIPVRFIYQLNMS